MLEYPDSLYRCVQQQRESVQHSGFRLTPCEPDAEACMRGEGGGVVWRCTMETEYSIAEIVISLVVVHLGWVVVLVVWEWSRGKL